MQTVETLATKVGVQAACQALAVPRSSRYALRRPKPTAPPRPVTPPPNALTALEKTAVVAELNRERFADQTPYEVYPQLLDEGRYLCSLRGMYRILAENRAVRDRRAQLHHPARPAPQVMARQPNRVWVVIGDVGPGQALLDAQLAEEPGEGLGRHRPAVVGVHGQLLGRELEALEAGGQQLLGVVAALFLGDEPADEEATE